MAVLTSTHNLSFGAKVRTRRTSGPINAHLRRKIYETYKLVFDYNGNMHVYNPRAGSE